MSKSNETSSRDNAIPKMAYIMNEILILDKLKGVSYVPALRRTYECDAFVYVCMDLCRGRELLSFVSPSDVLPMDVKIVVMLDMISAIQAIHDMQIAHRDVKLENFMLHVGRDHTVELRLIDFGLSCVTQKGKRHRIICGSQTYAAPEVYASNYDAQKADLWSLGVSLFTLAFAFPPFLMASSSDDRYLHFAKQCLKYPDQVPSTYVLLKMYRKQEYLATDDTCSWLKTISEMVDRLVQILPNKRSIPFYQCLTYRDALLASVKIDQTSHYTVADRSLKRTTCASGENGVSAKRSGLAHRTRTMKAPL